MQGTHETGGERLRKQENDNIFDIVSDVPAGLRDILGSNNFILRDDMDKIGSDLLSEIDNDRNSMDDYIRKYKKSLELAKMDSSGEDKTFPFVKASKVMMPYLMEAAVDFNARSSPDVIGTKTPCKVMTSDKERGARVAKAINILCTERIKNWRSDTDKKLIILPIVGTTFKKTWRCGKTGKIKSNMIWADDMIFDHSVTEFNEAPRHSFEYEIFKNDLIRGIRSETLLNLEEKDFKDRKEDSFTFIESHCKLDLDDDGYEEPYIVTLYKDTGKIVAIVPRFDEEDIEYDKKVIHIEEVNFFTQTIFIPDPFGTCMGLGFGILLSDIYESINSSARQLLDAGTLQNTGQNSGFIRNGSLSGPRKRNRSRKGSIEMVMGKFTTLESYGNSPLSNDIVNFPFQGPSQTLYQLFGELKLDTKNFTNKVVEPNPNEAAELYLSRLQQEMKRPTSIMMRVFRGISQEFRRIYELIRLYMPDEEYQKLIGEPNAKIEEDFKDSVDISTTADPSQGSEQERQARTSLILQKAQEMPQVLNVRQASINWLISLGLSDEEANNMAPKPDPNAKDPQEEMQKAYLEIEQIKTEAEVQRAKNEMMKLRMKAMEDAWASLKTEAEIENLGAKSLESLAKAGEKGGDPSAISIATEEIVETFEQVEDTDDNKGTTDGVAEPPSNQRV